MPRMSRAHAITITGCIVTAGAVAVSQEFRVESPYKTEPTRQNVIHFSGYEWTVKESTLFVGPGPNLFSTQNASLDDNGRLHLKIVHRGGQFTVAEVISTRNFGYGTYRFFITRPRLDPRIVLGLFTWDDSDADPAHREIDLEIGKFNDLSSANAQCVIQPWEVPGNLVRFEMPPGSAMHEFTWTPDRVTCRNGLVEVGKKTPPAELHEHTFTAGIPRPGGENVRINLWLLGGQPPLNNSNAEVIIDRFEFISASD